MDKGYKTTKIKHPDYPDRVQRYFFITEYLEFPLLIQFFMPIQKYPTNWFSGFSPALNLTTRQKTKIDKGSFSSSLSKKNRFWDINFVIGTNMMLSSHCNIDLRASIGLIPISKKSDFWGSKNISFVCLLGYFI